MSRYIAVWAPPDALTKPVVGHVAVTDHRLTLEGTGPDGRASSEQIRPDEIHGVQRFLRTAFRLDLSSGKSLVFTTIIGAGTLDDLLRDVLQLLS